MNENCYGRTVSGSPCELPAGHYPNTQHRISWPSPDGRPPGSFMTWTDEAMADFARIANEKFNAEHPEHGVE